MSERSAECRLREAYATYVAAYGPTRPGTRAAYDLARARLDLGLALDSMGEEMPELVKQQLQLDGEALLRGVMPLPEHQD